MDALNTVRPFRYRDTTRAEAEAHMAHLAKVSGCSDTEIESAERALRVRLPLSFRQYLSAMGHKPGALFVGSDLARMHELSDYRRTALEIMAESAQVPLPDDAVVFLMHQGYSFDFVIADGGEDAPVWRYTEGQPAPTRYADSFAEHLESEFQMIELANKETLELGGYFLSVKNGYEQRYYPALASGVRPIDTDDIFLD